MILRSENYKEFFKVFISIKQLVLHKKRWKSLQNFVDCSLMLWKQKTIVEIFGQHVTNFRTTTQKFFFLNHTRVHLFFPKSVESILMILVVKISPFLFLNYYKTLVCSKGCNFRTKSSFWTNFFLLERSWSKVLNYVKKNFFQSFGRFFYAHLVQH